MIGFKCNKNANEISNPAIRITILLYQIFYLLSTSLSAADAVIDNYALYPNTFVEQLTDALMISFHILGHVSFYIFLIERYHILFKKTPHSSNKCTFCFLIITAIIIEIGHASMHFIIYTQFVTKEWLHWVIVICFVCITLLYGSCLIILFINKLFNVIVDQRKSLSFSPFFDIEQADLSEAILSQQIQFDYQQISVIDLIAKNCILCISAIIFRNIGVIAFSLALHIIEDGKLNALLFILMIIYNIAFFCELISIYMTFRFANRFYKKICGKLHQCCFQYCQKKGKQKVTQADLSLLAGLHFVSSPIPPYEDDNVIDETILANYIVDK
eukprot:414954_1